MSSQPCVDGLELRGADVSRTGSAFHNAGCGYGQVVDAISSRKRVCGAIPSASCSAYSKRRPSRSLLPKARAAAQESKEKQESKGLNLAARVTALSNTCSPPSLGCRNFPRCVGCAFPVSPVKA